MSVRGLYQIRGWHNIGSTLGELVFLENRVDKYLFPAAHDISTANASGTIRGVTAPGLIQYHESR